MVLKDLEALIPPAVMAVLFIAVLVTIMRAQNPRRRAEARAREKAAEDSDPRIGG